uniref:SKA complex subunit 1 n=1 Tax=Panagrolaimus superbus TaxID=310955 RepID=A0A914Z244_9BILA
MGDESTLKIFDVIERKYKLSDFIDKDEIFTAIEECKENQKCATDLNSDIINKSNFLKSIASNSSSKLITAKDNDATPLATNNGLIPQDPPSRPQTPTFLIQPIEQNEHEKVPDYIRRYVNVSDLNNMILSLEKAFKNRIKLQKANYHKLTKAQKDVVLAMRDETNGLKLPPSAQFVSEEEWKKCLDLRMIPKIKWASQQLRHLKRLKETRFKQRIYYILL